MVATCGLGALKPNTIVIPLEEERCVKSFGIIFRENEVSSSVEILHKLRGMQNIELPLVSVVSCIFGIPYILASSLYIER